MTRGFAFEEAHPLAPQVPSLNLKGGIIYVDADNRLAFDSDKNNFQPRAGFAYRLGDKWVLRGGYGLFYLGAAEAGGSNGYSRPTSRIASNDGGQTPRVNLVNGFPEGLLKPIGNSQGRSTDTGLAVSTGLYVQVRAARDASDHQSYLANIAAAAAHVRATEGNDARRPLLAAPASLEAGHPVAAQGMVGTACRLWRLPRRFLPARASGVPRRTFPTSRSSGSGSASGGARRTSCSRTSGPGRRPAVRCSAR